jgi:hypothetical protein
MVNTGGTIFLSAGALAAGQLNVYGGVYIQSGGSATVSGNFSAIAGATGVLQFNGGTLTIGGSNVSAGSPFVVGNGSTAATLNLTGGIVDSRYKFTQGLTISPAAILAGGGSIVGLSVVTVYGTIAPDASENSIQINNVLTLEPSATTFIQRVGSTPSFGSIQTQGNIALAGVLALYEDAANEATPTAGQSFIILQATNGGVLSGAFANIASGRTLTTTDGTASFLVTIDPGVDGDVVLSDFQLVPEPGAVGVMGAVAAMGMMRRRRGDKSSKLKVKS